VTIASHVEAVGDVLSPRSTTYTPRGVQPSDAPSSAQQMIAWSELFPWERLALMLQPDR
jgi:hypothetical protein